MAFSGAQITRIGLSGFHRPLYGSFAGKTATEAISVGGGSSAYGRKRRRIRKEGRKKFELDDSKYLAEGFLQKLSEGVVEVAGVEVALQEPIELPPSAPPQPTQPVEALEDQTWQEIAQILRADAIDEYEQKVDDYLERMERLELEVQFVVMTLLDDDF